MPPAVIDIRSADDARDVVHLAVQALAEGKLVAFPTETVYGLAASALSAAAVERLLRTKGRAEKNPLPLAIKGADEAVDYVPDISPLARRLARRCWPGPVTLVLADNHPDSLAQQLPPTVRQAVVPQATIGLRVPAHRAVMDVLRMLTGPLVLTSANRSGETEATTAEQVVHTFDNEVALVLNDGPCRYGQPSTVVQVDRQSFKILRAGVMAERTLQRLSSMMILLVCTGNTCRSPMAEALVRKKVADRLGCKLDEIEQRGVIVQSAGVSASPGGRATPEAVEVMARRGLDLSQHASQPLSASLVQQSDVIFTMTRSHLATLLSQHPEATNRAKLLAKDESDIADPIGGPAALYERCAQQIDEALGPRLDDLSL
jgi:protein-tyrosine phosphatase